MIKVCHIITQLELGGAQQNTLYTVKHLDRTRFLPFLITGSEGILIEEAEQYTDVQKYYLPQLIREIRPGKDVVAFYKLWRFLRQERRKSVQTPFIVHTHSSKAGILGRWAAKLAGVPVIIHSIHGFGFHSYQSSLQRWLFIFLEFCTSKITNHFIAVSSTNIATGIRLGLFPKSRVSLIRSGIDIARFRVSPHDADSDGSQQREKLLQELGIPQHKRIIAMIACFKPQKAPLDFVRVIQIVSKTFPNIHAIMVGDGLLRPQIEAMIAYHGLEQTISLPGWRHDIPELLHLCHILVLTSLWEGLPRVCLQAMAAGLPIVATNVDGIPEAVRDGVNGFLFQPGDVRGMAEKIVYLLNNSDVAERMGLQGQQHVDEFDIRLMVQQQETLYQSLITHAKNGRKVKVNS